MPAETTAPSPDARPDDSAPRVRPLGPEDHARQWRLHALSFGEDLTSPPDPGSEPEGAVRYGAVGRGEDLLGAVTLLPREHWWGGRRVGAADVTDVAVQPEARGAGVATSLLRALLEGGRERGAAVSALFPTVAGLYRRAGWEVTGTLTTVEVPTHALNRGGPAPGLATRTGGPADLPAVAELYEREARARSGMLVRPAPPTDRLPEGVDGLTLVEDGDRLVAAASWHRGRGYGREAVFTVRDVVADTPAAARTLLGVLGGWAPVARNLHLRLLRGDAVAAALPVELARVVDRKVVMHRVVDVERAMAQRGWPSAVRGSVVVALEDDLAPWNSGTWELAVSGGEGAARRTDAEPVVRLTPSGLAGLYAGSTTALGAVRTAGAEVLVEDRAAGLAALDVLACGDLVEVLDYF
ncbi:enhanced intracellular survival protein Eis [uncultured Pseudokineococcus sp.]|uniref:GNAT family N-acetyltransferase n=1 Tax=uncultured Pseudokineococcus sp. TaxID=1642928 RepID=UPI002627E8EC|nr:GNAT family N-acetyltransferase [uncultured Pseudokineococcus sp.]